MAIQQQPQGVGAYRHKARNSSAKSLSFVGYECSQQSEEASKLCILQRKCIGVMTCI